MENTTEEFTEVFVCDTVDGLGGGIRAFGRIDQMHETRESAEEVCAKWESEYGEDNSWVITLKAKKEVVAKYLRTPELDRNLGEFRESEIVANDDDPGSVGRCLG